jgi:hypothetical protein
MVQDAYLEIYGSLSTTCKINVELTVQSNFQIEKIYGIEDMYEASLIDKKTFKFKLIHFVYGKKYNYVALVNVPENTEIGTVILTATVSPFGKTVNYYWNQAYSISAYEEYIKCISFTYFLDAYNYGKTKGVVIMENAINWLKSYYYGLRNWLNEYNDILNDLQNLETFGKQNILSKLRELKSSKLGIHYNDENSYQKEIIDNSHNIDVSDLTPEVIAGENIVILGTLRGLAHAGAKGNKKAIIASNLIDSPQIRIANIVKEMEKEELENNYRCAFVNENDEVAME